MKFIMNVKPLATTVLVLLCGIACAQPVRLQITLKTAGKDSLVNASIQLYSLPDTLLKQSQIGLPGKNVFSVSPNSSFLIKVSSVGFSAVQKTVNVAGKPVSVNIE